MRSPYKWGVIEEGNQTALEKALLCAGTSESLTVPLNSTFRTDQKEVLEGLGGWTSQHPRKVVLGITRRPGSMETVDRRASVGCPGSVETVDRGHRLDVQGAWKYWQGKQGSLAFICVSARTLCRIPTPNPGDGHRSKWL